MNARPQPLEVACEERLCAFVRERTGLRIHDHQLATLRQTMADGCERFGYSGCEEYLAVLEGAAGDSPEHEHLIAGITVGESYFFRDQGQMDFLRQVWLPRLIERRRAEGDLYLRIWSAGCSDGQELYSLTVMLHELLPDIKRWNLHLLGTDINVPALSRAMRGQYRKWSFRATPAEVRERYFRKSSEQFWQIASQLRQGVKFTYLNLNEDSFPSILSETNSLDLILCRNVFIYFDLLVVGQIMAKLHASLVEGGCLLLGTSDLVDSTTLEGFDLHTLPNTFYLLRLHDEAPAQPPTVYPPPHEEQPQPEPELPAPPPAMEAEPVPAQPAENVVGLEELIQLLGNEAWAEALAEVEKRQWAGDGSALLWQFRAKALANLGRTREALESCDRSLAADATDKHTHFIRGLILTELNRLPAAEEAIKRTLYLDRNFVEAHFQLGLLRLRSNRRADGIKSLRNALSIADAAPPERLLHDGAGMTHGRIAAILRNELSMYERGLKTGKRRKGEHKVSLGPDA